LVEIYRCYIIGIDLKSLVGQNPDLSSVLPADKVAAFIPITRENPISNKPREVRRLCLTWFLLLSLVSVFLFVIASFTNQSY
jgi:hypothetical protein